MSARYVWRRSARHGPDAHAHGVLCVGSWHLLAQGVGATGFQRATQEKAPRVLTCPRSRSCPLYSDAPNDGRNDHPVVSFSLGNSCIFGVCHRWSWQRAKEHATQIPLHSGDAILFGGPCRNIHHAVTGVQRGTCPAALRPQLGDARLNLTFRDAPAVQGLEQTTYKFFAPPKPKKRARPRAPRAPGMGAAADEAGGRRRKHGEVEDVRDADAALVAPDLGRACP